MAHESKHGSKHEAPKIIYSVPILAILFYFTFFSASLAAQLMGSTMFVGVLCILYLQYKV
jgi:hypothetical protein